MRLARVTIGAPGARLAGIVYTPDGKRRPLGVVLAHGYTASKETMDLPASYLCGRGYPCLTFDFRGHKLGGSTGAMTGAEDALADMRAAADFARVRLEA
jgi:pimeloyl-ACP methyl ester carboxylesterase